MQSTPEGMKLIIPAHDLHLVEDLIDGKIEYRTAMITVIGKLAINIEHEKVSVNDYGTRIIVDTEDLSSTLKELYHSLFSLQD
jgi:hypothetical protein